MRNKITVLMTGSGAPGGPGILNALTREPRINLHVADMNPLAAGSLLHDKSHTIPEADSPAFIDAIETLCFSEKVDVIFPLVTKELLTLSKNKSRFEALGIKVLASSHEAMSVLNNKGALLQHLASEDIPHPEFLLAKNAADLNAAVHSLGYPSKPVVIKPSNGNGSRGIRILDPSVDQYDLLFNHKPNSLYSSLDVVLESISDQLIPEMVISEYLPGPELTIDSVIADGDIVELMIRTRDTMRNGISTSGRFIENASIESYVRKIVSSFNRNDLEGPVGFQVKKSRDGQYLILESNPRIQGTSVAAIGCGVNLPVLSVLSSLGIALPYIKQSNIGFSRYYDEVYYAT